MGANLAAADPILRMAAFQVLQTLPGTELRDAVASQLIEHADDRRGVVSLDVLKTAIALLMWVDRMSQEDPDQSVPTLFATEVVAGLHAEMKNYLTAEKLATSLMPAL